MPLLRLAGVLVALGLWASPVPAQDGALKDLHGDLLPPGALARLGAARFRVPGPVLGARFVDGGKKLLVHVEQEINTFRSRDHQGTFRLFDAEKGLEQGQLPIGMNRILEHWSGSGAIAEGLTFSEWCISADGKMLASVEGYRSSELKVRDLATGKVVFEIRDRPLDFSFVQFSPDGKRLAAIERHTYDTKKKEGPPVVIRMWDLQSHKEIRTFVPLQNADAAFQAHWLMFSPDGAHLAATGHENGKGGVLRVWNVAGDAPSVKLEGHSEDCRLARVVAFSPDSKTLAATHDGKIKLWDPATGQQVKVLVEHAERCATLDFSPDGKRLIAGAGAETVSANRVRLWDLADGKEIALPVRTAQAYVFSDSGKAVALADAAESSLVICDAATGQSQSKIRVGIPHGAGEPLEHLFYKARQGMGWPMGLSPDGKTLVACDKPGQIRRFEVATGQEIPAAGSVTDPATAMVFSPDGKKLLTAGLGRVLLQEVDGSASPRQFLVKVDPPADPLKRPDVPHPTAVAISSDGKRAAAGWDHGVVAVWDLATGKTLWQAAGHPSVVASVAFTSNDKTLVSTGFRDRTVIWWDVPSGERRRTWTRNVDKFDRQSVALVLGPGALTGFIANESDLLEWELASGKVRRQLKRPGDAVAVSPDGRFLLAVDPRYFQLIDLLSGEEKRCFAFLNEVRARYDHRPMACFSPDGRMIAGIAGKDVVRLWDRATATVMATLTGHDGGALAMAFTPDGRSVATSAGNGTILLWPAPAAPLATGVESPPKAFAVHAGAKDSEGEPLPAGAKARLGSLRFQGGADIVALRYSADAKAILSQSFTWDGSGFWTDLALWNAASGKLQWQQTTSWEYSGAITRHPRPRAIWTVTENAKFLATSDSYSGRNSRSLGRHLSVTEIGTGRTVFKAKKADEASDALFAPDNKTLFDFGHFTLTDLETGNERELERLKTDSHVKYAQFSPDSKILVMVYSDRSMAYWNLDRGNTGVRLPQSVADATRPVIAPDSRQIAMMARRPDDHTVDLILVDIASGKTVRKFNSYQHLDVVHRLVFAPDGKQLVVACSLWAEWENQGGKSVLVNPARHSIQRWDVVTGKEMTPIAISKRATVQFAPRGQILALAEGKFLRLHDASSGREIRRLPLEVMPTDDGVRQDSNNPGVGDPFAFSPDGKKVAVAAGRTIRQFEMATGKEIGATPNSQTIISVAAAQAGKWIASLALNLIQVWDRPANKLALTVKPWIAADPQEVSLTAMALSPDGCRLAVGGSDGGVVIFDVPSAKQLQRLQFHSAPVTSLAFGTDGATLASCDYTTQVAIWDVASGNRLRTWQALRSNLDPPWKVDAYKGEPYMQNAKGGWGDSWCNWPALSIDGRCLVTRKETAIGIYDLATLKLRTINGDDYHGYKVAMPPGGQLVAVAGNYVGVRLIEDSTGKELRALAALAPLSDCCVSWDGKFVAASADSGIRLWDTATGTLQAEFNGHRGPVTAVSFSPDGGSFVSAAHDGTMLVWDVAALCSKPGTKEVAPGELQSLWEDLASSNAELAGKAILRLAGHPKEAIAWVRENLKPLSAPTKEALAQLVADLDDARPKVREKANHELKQLAEIAEPALRACLAAKPTLEQRRRVDLLLAKLDEPITDAATLSGLRAVETLELTAEAEALAVLQALAAGPEGGHLTREAAAALARLRTPGRPSRN